MTVSEAHDFRKGRQVTQGRPTPTEPFHATIVTRDSINDFLGVTTTAERTAALRGLRDLGLLVHNKGRLTQRVGTGAARTTGYVFRGKATDVPRRRERRHRERVTLW